MATDTAESAHSQETVAKNSRLGKWLTKSGYLYVVGLNVAVLCGLDVPISLQVLSTSLTCIVLGSLASLRHPESVEAQEVERMKPGDAYMFPVFGSAALCSFYGMIKYLPSWLMDVAVQGFFVLMSVFAAQALLDEVAQQFVPAPLLAAVSAELCQLVIRYKLLCAVPVAAKQVWLPLPSIGRAGAAKPKADTEVLSVSVLSVATLGLGALVALLWARDQSWFLNNLIGISLSVQAISFLNPGSFYTAVVLLALLFFYDIFWVFGTDVMVTVAKNLKAPIKLVFPRPAVSDKPNMLGLGDIVLPGIYVALLLRYDVQRTYRNVDFSQLGQLGQLNLQQLPPLNLTTFCAALLCYALSLAACLACMWLYDAAQPALLYICPGVILPVVALAWLRGDLQQLWKYDEEPERESHTKKE